MNGNNKLILSYLIDANINIEGKTHCNTSKCLGLKETFLFASLFS